MILFVAQLCCDDDDSDVAGAMICLEFSNACFLYRNVPVSFSVSQQHLCGRGCVKWQVGSTCSDIVDLF